MLFKILLTYRKQLLIIAAMIACGSGGYWYAVNSLTPQIITKVEVVEKIVVREKVKTVTVIQQNVDGSSTTTIRQQSESLSNTSSNKKLTPTSVFKASTRYKVGAVVSQRFPVKNELNYGILLGVRVFGPVWIEGSFIPATRTGLVGVSVEF